MLTSTEKNIEFVREQAAISLAGKLHEHKTSGAIVVSVPKGGTPVAHSVSQLLNLPFELAVCKRIEHPGVRGKSIGSVSLDEVVVNERTQRIPQDYIYHQIRLIKNSLKRQYRFFCGDHKPRALKDKVVILVDDFLDSGDTLLACLKSIRKQGPEKVIVALVLSSRSGISQIVPLADEIIVLNIIDDPFVLEEVKQNLPRVTPDEVRDLFAQAQADENRTNHSLN